MATKQPPPPPKAIAKLATAVVNRIAAGEIIQRPANALKELIENALDAGATSIRVTVKDGGTKLLQIQDNGSGIRKADLPILCERFTTSKIRAFDDLTSLSSYGFRGEALASISHVAHLAVTTKTRDDSCAWKAAYSDGVMVPVKVGGDSEPVPSAGNDGTLIVVEDLFFNTPTRLKSLKSSSDEYARIVQVLLAYSIHNAGVAVVCKKAGSASSEVQTVVGASVLDNLGVHYGEQVKRELVEVVVEDAKLGVKASGWFSGANYAGKKGTFLFFINHRLVECTPLKRAFEAFYGSLLPKGAHPFVYLALDILPTKVDVNVHPTKREVGFEDADEVVELVCDALAKTLEKDGGSRTFKVQTLLPGAKPPTDTPAASRTQSRTTSSSSAKPPTSTSSSSTTTARKVAPNKLVRTDQHAQTLDAFLTPTAAGDEARPSKRRKSDHDPDFATQLAQEAASGGGGGPRARIAQSECLLKSVRDLRKESIARCHAELDTIVKNHIFVGVADLGGSLSMLQHQTKLYLVNHASLAEELFYQLGLRQFGRFVRIKLKPSPPLKDLVRLAVERDAGSSSAPMSKDAIVERVYETLTSSRAMLDEYFSFGLNDAGEIESLPLILPGYTPSLNKLPLFLIRIGVHVDWTDEKNCFETFLRELAYFYAPAAGEGEGEEQDATTTRQIQHVVFPAAKQYLLPPETLLKKDFVQVTSLESLYKVNMHLRTFTLALSIFASDIVLAHPGEVHEAPVPKEIARRQFASDKRSGVASQFLSAAPATYTALANTTCVTAPEVMEGPYYINDELVRTDLTEDQPGVPLRLAGIDDTYLIYIETIYPGFYTGRTIHVHVMIHTDYAIADNGTLISSAGAVRHVGQIFFDEALNSQVLATPAYQNSTQVHTTNEQDDILTSQNMDGNNAFADTSLLGSSVADGVL
ncbi:hypothetical protein RQP46_008235 [Phenoliferia psychrophenolica]